MHRSMEPQVCDLCLCVCLSVIYVGTVQWNSLVLWDSPTGPSLKQEERIRLRTVDVVVMRLSSLLASVSCPQDVSLV